MHKRLTRAEQTSAKVAARRGSGRQGDAQKSAGVKTCPCCHAKCFADMEVCYGCLHVFDDEALPAVAEEACDETPGDEVTRGETACAERALDEAACDLGVAPGAAKAMFKSAQASEALAKKRPSPLGGGEGLGSRSGVEFVKILELSIGLRIAHDGKGRISAEITGAEEESR